MRVPDLPVPAERPPRVRVPVLLRAQGRTLMAVPRRDRETKPVAAAVQFEIRLRADQYGLRARTGRDRVARPVAVRNGMPVRPYVYRGTGEDQNPETAVRMGRPKRGKEA